MKFLSRPLLVVAVVIGLSACEPGLGGQTTAAGQPPHGGLQEVGVITAVVLGPVPLGKTKPQDCQLVLEPAHGYGRPQGLANGPAKPLAGRRERHSLGETWCASISAGTAYAIFWDSGETLYLTRYDQVRTRAHLVAHPSEAAFCLAAFYSPHQSGELVTNVGPFPRPFCEQIGPPYDLVPSATPVPVSPSERN
jgi:hypothetical protein